MSFGSKGVTEYQDILKLIVSTAEFDASLICQAGLEQPQLTQRPVPQRNSTLNRLLQRVTTRHLAVAQIDEVDEWLTSQVTVITTRPRDTVSIRQDVPTPLGMGATLQPHPSLQAVVRLTTVSQSTRDLEQLLPPILRDNTQPFQFTASRGVDPGLSVLELKLIDATTLNTVTPEQPLKLLVDRALGENEYVLPVAYDGEFFVPLGRGERKDDKTEIRLERLSDPLAEKRRSLGGSIRIFFQKIVADKLDLEFPYPILAAVEYGKEGTIRYEGDLEKVKQRVASANKIVLFIHGIIGDTQSIVPCARDAKIDLDGQEKSLTEIYDLVLAFDYENLNTPIGTIAEQLRDRLSTVGLGANHDKILHIVAHSMGGLVSRSLIEQKGGDRIVQHLIMLGTPNGGSPWSTVQDWATTTLAINSLSIVALPVKVLGSLVAAIEVIDINLDEMKPGSDFLTALRDCADPGIPYTILAGNTSLIPPPDPETGNQIKTLLEKLGRGAIEFPFLGQPNDIAVTVHSIKSVPPERHPQSVMREVACNHLVYFTHPDGLQSLAEAVIGTGILATDVDSDRQTAEGDDIESVAIRPNTSASEGIPTWLIGLIVALLIGAGGGFWLWQQFKDKEPTHQDNPSQSIINP
jgi:pimeloyl-ACP methyl ester carboxylesterase